MRGKSASGAGKHARQAIVIASRFAMQGVHWRISRRRPEGLPPRGGDRAVPSSGRDRAGAQRGGAEEHRQSPVLADAVYTSLNKVKGWPVIAVTEKRAAVQRRALPEE